MGTFNYQLVLIRFSKQNAVANLKPLHKPSDGPALSKFKEREREIDMCE